MKRTQKKPAAAPAINPRIVVHIAGTKAFEFRLAFLVALGGKASGSVDVPLPPNGEPVRFPICVEVTP